MENTDPLAPKRILVADDEPHIGRIIQLKLDRSPHHTVLVQDGRQAMEALQSDTPIDLVLLDIMMPYFSGLDVLEAVRKMEHRLGLPVIILTAKGQDADRERALSLGATDYLTKPFSPNKLLARINELLD